MRILTTIEVYTPGYKGGGAIRSLEGLIDALGDEHEFLVITSDRDTGSDTAHPGIEIGAWQPVGKARVLYLPPGRDGRKRLVKALREERYDALYLNSLFARDFTLLPLALRRAGRLPDVPAILAPRGACTPGSLAIKRAKKRLFLGLAAATGLYRGIAWHAATEEEAADVRRLFPDAAPIHVAVDIPKVRSDLLRPKAKRAGHLSIACVARIGRVKNLHFALELLRGLEGEIRFDLFGPVEEADYWAECLEVAASLPPNVDFVHHGPTPHDEVAAIFAEADLCFLPSLGESFGHVFVEALASGCPLLISDRTPWRGLEAAGAGWDLPLERPEAFVEALRRLVAMGPEEHRALSEGARRLAAEALRHDRLVEPSRALFRSVESVEAGLGLAS